MPDEDDWLLMKNRIKFTNHDNILYLNSLRENEILNKKK